MDNHVIKLQKNIEMTNKDIKLLWGRSGNRCAMCKHELSEDPKKVSKLHPLGEQAHIVAEEENGPRGKSILTPKERDAYPNRMLLCPTDHTKIDKHVDDYPIEKLHQIKTEHEEWVREKLSQDVDYRDEVHQLVYADMIDSVVGALDLPHWQIWSSQVLAPEPYWRDDAPHRSFDLIKKMLRTNWSGTNDELERAIKSVIFCFHEAVETFLEHSERSREEDYYFPHKFYRENPHRLEEWHEWVNRCYERVYLLAKSLNWFADVVRRDINPLFYALEGKFTVVEGPFENFSFKTRLYQFTEAEKKDLPKSIEKDLVHTF